MPPLSFCLAALPLMAAAVPAQVQWYQSPVNGHLYVASPQMTWQDAEAYASSLGGHLATVRGPAEQDWLTEQFGTQDLWIGVHDPAQNGRFVRSSGEPAGFTAWADGMPSSVAGADCVLSAERGWLSVPGSLLRFGVVELVNLGAYGPFGVGCATSTGVPVLSAAFPPRLGSTFDAQIFNLPTTPEAGAVLMLFGFSNSMFGSIPLPADLGSFGIPGCTGYVSGDVVFPVTTIGSVAQWSLAIPDLPRLLGLRFYNQVLVEEIGLNPFGAAMSNAAEAVIGAEERYATGFGPSIATHLAIAVGDTHALVADVGTSLTVLAVDLETGGRTVLAHPTTYGTGPVIGGARGIDLLGERAFVTHVGALPGVTEVDVLTGERRVLSDALTGIGPAFGAPFGIAVDGDRALVTDQGRNAVFSVDLATGDRTIVADAVTGVGQAFFSVAGIAVLDGQALVVDSAIAAVYLLDPVSGNRSVLSALGSGSGPPFRTPVRIATDTNRAFVTDVALEVVVAVDLGTGDRTILSGANAGLGPLFDTLEGIAIDGDRALVMDINANEIVAVDLQDGDRSVFSK